VPVQTITPIIRPAKRLDRRDGRWIITLSCGHRLYRDQLTHSAIHDAFECGYCEGLPFE
jgi:hypothetical protein